MSENFFVVTGGPGAGKTSIINAAARQGLLTMPEGGRAIIHDQTRIDGPARPNVNFAAFGESLLTWHLYSHRLASVLQNGPVLFDRGIPDVIGTFDAQNLSVPPHIVKAAETFRYNQTVFIAPPWPEIYTTDQERTETFDEALLNYESQHRAYVNSGYTVIPIPRGTIADRLSWMANQIAQHQ